ncbi:unnamed protein product [Triticum turgidum subsp. durum]|uniref:L-type lectin-domain containing receptor kinase IX.1 n=1 Tax=Triticum turgidum subsp. durum TaxID=4567 RepID=A0A9R0TJI4_TRITD|nr:unnamed protein product [Triticum turgidum subsp. durum]
MGSRRRRSLTTLVLVLLCLYHAPRMALSLSFNLNFSDPGVPNRGASINFAGQAFLSSSTLELTTNTSDAHIQYSTSRASYVHKVPLWNSATGETASFTTTFSFRITPDRDSPSDAGDGMAFFLGHFPSVIPAKSEGGSLGLLPALTNGTGYTRIVAVEFDTFLNPQNADVNGNHVGIDVNSVNSTASTDTTTIPGRNLTSSHVMTATVKYHNGSKLLAVDLLIDDAMYQVNATIDLRRYLPEEVAIGFSAATGWAAELHQILSWSFSSTLQLESQLESNTEAPPPSQLPPPTSNKHKMLVVTLLSVLVPLLFLLACVAMVTLWRRHEKRRSKRANGDSSSDSDDEEHCVDRAGLERGVAAGGPKRYTYHELVAATSNFAEEEKLGRGGFAAGYIDPEFVNTRRPSTESDVYSFGVVLLEIVSGRRPVVETAEISFTLLRWVWSLYGRDAVLDAADERLRGDEADEWWMERVLVVGLWCAHPERSERPSVAQAMSILQSEEARLPALPLHVYRTVPDLASSGRHGAFSPDGTDRVGSSLVNTGDATLSSDSSPIALLRRSKDLAN